MSKFQKKPGTGINSETPNVFNDLDIRIGGFFLFEEKLWVRTDRCAAMNAQYGDCSFHDVNPEEITPIRFETVEALVLNQTRAKVDDAIKTLNNALYFNDSSDYGSRIGTALKQLCPDWNPDEKLTYMDDSTPTPEPEVVSAPCCPTCYRHVSHPCEKCGRLLGRKAPKYSELLSEVKKIRQTLNTLLGDSDANQK